MSEIEPVSKAALAQSATQTRSTRVIPLAAHPSPVTPARQVIVADQRAATGLQVSCTGSDYPATDSWHPKVFLRLTPVSSKAGDKQPLRGQRQLQASCPYCGRTYLLAPLDLTHQI